MRKLAIIGGLLAVLGWGGAVFAAVQFPLVVTEITVDGNHEIRLETLRPDFQVARSRLAVERPSHGFPCLSFADQPRVTATQLLEELLEDQSLSVALVVRSDV